MEDPPSCSAVLAFLNTQPPGYGLSAGGIASLVVGPVSLVQCETRLMNMAQRGELEHIGGGEFRLPGPAKPFQPLIAGWYWALWTEGDQWEIVEWTASREDCPETIWRAGSVEFYGPTDIQAWGPRVERPQFLINPGPKRTT